MLTVPPPGYDVSAINRQSNQLLGKPGTVPVGTPASPAFRAVASQPAMSANPMASANLPPQIQYILKALKGGA